MGQAPAYGNFSRALDSGNLTIIRAAAVELTAVNLEDALRVALRPCDQEPENAERAALRWLGRFCLERRDVTLALSAGSVGRLRRDR